VADELLPLIAAGDALAFGRWVAGCEHSLRLSLRRFAASCDTEAVLQEALLRVWQVAPKFKPDGKPDALLRFAAVTARNVALSEVRKLGTRMPELPAELEAVATSTDPLLRAAVNDCREKLPKQPRLALDQRLESAGSDDDHVLAERVGMKLNTFLQNFTRARKLLAECLGKRGIDLTTEMTP
jgi:DNA-directed RNA polymerase specialized sigma24 family protein